MGCRIKFLNNNPVGNLSSIALPVPTNGGIILRNEESVLTT
jgi:hypothetical protein